MLRGFVFVYGGNRLMVSILGSAWAGRFMHDLRSLLAYFGCPRSSVGRARPW